MVAVAVAVVVVSCFRISMHVSRAFLAAPPFPSFENLQLRPGVPFACATLLCVVLKTTKENERS